MKRTGWSVFGALAASGIISCSADYGESGGAAASAGSGRGGNVASAGSAASSSGGTATGGSATGGSGGNAASSGGAATGGSGGSVQQPATHFAGPTAQGAGDCLSEANRGRLEDCLARSDFGPGSVLELWAAGPSDKQTVYTRTGSSPVFQPPKERSGTSDEPMTVRPKYPGQVVLDAQFERQAMSICTENSHWVIEDLDLRNGLATGSSLLQVCGKSNHNTFRRLVMYNGPAASNSACLNISNSTGTILEDIAAFGTCRKSISASQRGDDVRAARLFGIFQGSDFSGPKNVLTMGYRAYRNVFVDAVAMWDETHTTTSPRYGMFTTGTMAPFAPADACHDSTTAGMLGIVRGAFVAGWSYGALYGDRATDCSTFRDGYFYMEGHSSLRPYQLSRYDGGQNPALSCVHCQHDAHNFTFVGFGSPGVASVGGSGGWTISNFAEHATIAAAPNIFTGTAGGKFCKRHDFDGNLTDEGLFTADGKWPMGDRIKQAMLADGRDPTRYFGPSGELGQYIADTFNDGTIPSACRQQ